MRLDPDRPIVVGETMVKVLTDFGTVFQVFDLQDSGCTSYGVRSRSGDLRFVKSTAVAEMRERLHDAAELARRTKNPLLPYCYGEIETSDGSAIVYEWVDGEVLNGPAYPGEAGRNDPRSPHFRFRSLPHSGRLAVLDAIYLLHLELDELGYVAEDFYDGCILYDFGRKQVHVCDLDHYHRGSYILDRTRAHGSGRFMAPEEFVRGSRIDSRSTVYTLGRTGFIFLSNNKTDLESWPGSSELYGVLQKATNPDKSKRYATVREFVDRWRDAMGRPSDP